MDYEPDQRHAELVVRGLRLEGAKEVATPWGEPQKWMEEEDGKELEGMERKEFRTWPARANYLAMDRPDIQFSTKEVCRGTARPTKGDWRKLKRLGRYLVEQMRTVMRYPWQGDEKEITGHTDWSAASILARSALTARASRTLIGGSPPRAHLNRAYQGISGY